MAFPSGFEHIVKEQEPLARHTWLRLGGPARYFVEPTNRQELIAVVQRAHEAGLPLRLLGGGSNLLVRDEGVEGVVLQLTAAEFGAIQVHGNRLTAGGGARLGHVISAAVREGLAGLEELVGIPGTLGGALHGNAGTQNRDIGQGTSSATMLTREGKLVTKSRPDLTFAYHYSSLDELVILEATFELESGDPRTLTKRMQQHWIGQRAVQPLADQNVARMFKDPPGSTAAELLEQAGLKTVREGDVELSSRNSNYVVAGAKARSGDVLALIEDLRKKVKDRTSVELELALDVW